MLCFFLTGCGESSESTGTVWYSGSDFSEASSANTGDFFLDTDDGCVYRYVLGSWIYVMTLKGENGDNAYVHIVYSAYADGTNNGSASFSSTWSSGCSYIGIYSGTLEIAPTDASAYTWILISFESSSDTPSTETTYTITYELNGGTNSDDNPDTYTSSSATITLASPTRDGYTFVGWYSDSAFTTRVTRIASGSTGNVTLYARWTETVAGEVNVDITDQFSWTDGDGWIVINANVYLNGSSAVFKYSNKVDISQYAGLGYYLCITVPVYTSSSGIQTGYGVAFTTAAASSTATSGLTPVAYYQARTLAMAGVDTTTVETVYIEIPDGAVTVVADYFSDSYITNNSLSISDFSASIVSSCPN